MTRPRCNVLSNLFLIFIVTLVVRANETKEVKLNQGVVSGKAKSSFLRQKEYYSFRGIPYAEPPVGPLRFQPPKPLKSWEGIRKAYDNKPTCMQFSTRERMNEPIGLSGSEDCLYISVHTPGLEGDYSVVVFDYNDNFRTGFNGTKIYSPDFFVEEDVIVVTISHRLGLFGYLTTEDDVIPPNNGIRDFILGLQWVRDNIDKFGGDKDRVTLMGSRGGAALVNILLYSEKAKGLFSAAVLHSGTALETIYFYQNPKSKAFEFGEVLDIKTDESRILLEGLQNIDVEKLLLYEGKVLDYNNIEVNQIPLSFPFGPVIEKVNKNAIITALPEKGRIVNDVPILIGFTSREGLDLVSNLLFMPRLIDSILHSASVQLPVRTGFRFDPNSTVYQKDASLDVNEFYFKDGYLHTMNIPEYSVLVGDVQHSYAMDLSAKKLAKDLLSPVFYFLFDFRGSLNENSHFIMKYNKFRQRHWGATVADELCYLHLCSRMKKTYVELINLVSEQKEIKLLRKMVKLWTNFAKIGNPTPETDDSVLKGIVWKPMAKDSSDADYLHISKNFKMKKNPLGKRGKFWDIFIEKYGKMAVDGVVSEDQPATESVREKLRKYYGDEDGENYEGHDLNYFEPPKRKNEQIKVKEEIYKEIKESVILVEDRHDEF